MNIIKGIYVLVISASKGIKVNVGALDILNFERGLYAYVGSVGSAQNNLEKRIMRHLRKAKRRFWHIDYLLENEFASVVRVFYKKAKRPEECKIARKLSKMSIPVVDFGCSDCGCVSHLFMVNGSDESRSSMAFLERTLRAQGMHNLGMVYSNASIALSSSNPNQLIARR